MKCIHCPDCDDGRCDELLPPHRNPDDSLTRRVPCPTCDGTCEVDDDRDERILDTFARLADAAERLGAAARWTK